MFDSWMTILVGALLTAAVAAAVVNFVPAALIKKRQRMALVESCRGKLALTYDDGPDPLLTPQLLQLLDRYGVKASFFLVGFRAERSPAMSDLLAKSGHELGCHTDRHRHSWRVAPWQAVRDVSDGYERMKRWMPATALFRPPFGKLTTPTWLEAKRRGAPLCWWTHDGGDTWPALPDPAAITERIFRADGAVVLMHSHDRGRDRHEYVLTLTEQLLNAARDHGWQVCTMSEVLATASKTDSRMEGVTHAGKA
jgi:peptidoglycan-N-acetylglucosamine deacetylase